jgi:WD40 repeat protein
MVRRWIPLMFASLVSASVAIAGSGQAPVQDAFGDPLPAGAVARLGTLRFRHESNIVFATFLRDGKRVLSMSDDGGLRVWDFPSGTVLQRLDQLAGTAGVAGATLSPDDKHLSVFGDDGFLHIWDWANAKQLGKVARVAGAPRLPRNTNTPAAESVYSPDGRTLLVFGTSRILQIVDLASGKEVGPGSGHTDSIIAISFTPDGRQVLTRDALGTHTWDAATGKPVAVAVRKLPDTAGSPTVFSPDGRLGVTVMRFASPAVARAAKSREAILFDTATGKELAKIDLAVEVTPLHRNPIVFSPDGRILAASGNAAQHTIDLYELPSGKLQRSIDAGQAAGPNVGAKGIAWGAAKNGAGGVPAGGKGMGGAKGAKGGKGGGAAFPGGAIGGGGPAGGGLAGGVFANAAFSRASALTQRLLFSPDGTALAFQAMRDGPVLVLDTMTGKTIGTLDLGDTPPNLPAEFTPDTRCLAVEGGDGTVRLYEVATGQLRTAIGPNQSKAKVGDADPLGNAMFGGPGVVVRSRSSFAIAPNGKLLALSGPGGAIHIRSAWTGKDLTVLKGHTAAVNALAFAPDGKSLASGSDDMTALIWDVTRFARPAPGAAAVKPDDLERAWQTLAAPDAGKAFAAMREFVAAPADAVAWIKTRLKPVPPLDRKRVDDLIKQLEDDQFTAREEAAAELTKLGEPVLPVLAKVLASNPLPEARVRLEQVRTKLAPVMQGDRLRAYRAVEVLEVIGTPEARAVLQMVADGAPGTLLTTSAQAALRR